jgi:hypothetical protein
MSQSIPRYSIDRNSRYGFVDNTEGKFCEYRDYADLAAENERLRKAGDAMYAAAVQDSTGLWVLKPFQDWKAAKQGM